MDELSRIFRAIEAGEPIDTDDLLPEVYNELRGLARALLAQESPGQTLQATALVHETYMRLARATAADSDAKQVDVGQKPSRRETSSDSATRSEVDFTWKCRAHFFAAAAEAMRRILIDAARRKKRLKRGGDRQRVDLKPSELLVTAPPDDLLELDDALGALERLDAVKANVVKLRYFAGLSVEETAEALGISTASVKRYWAYSKAWLRREMEKGDPS